MSLILNVPYEEKDEAKALGAKWNPQLKKWYVEKRKDYHKFIKWILGGKEQVYILCDCIYIVEGIHTCFKCRNLTKVIGYGIKKYFDVCNPEVYGEEDAWSFEDDEIHIASHIYPLPEKLLNYLKDKYGYFKSYSQTVQSSYLANHCSNCKVIQGDFYLFGEVDSPFFIDSEERAKQLKLYKIPLKNDIIVEGDIGWGSEDWMIEDFAENMDLSIDGMWE